MGMSKPKASSSTQAPLSAVIIGAGFAGIGMAVSLRKSGITDFVIIEKAHDVGGVWRDNRYPGAACDVPSHLYSFSFEPNPNWSYVFARQPEIAAYLRRCADKYDLRRHIQFSAEVESARYDDSNSLWLVRLKDGRNFTSRLLVSAVGQLSRPALPKLPGMESFQGHCFHSANWDESYALEGKRVAVVGTGASAIQFVPEIARQVDKLHVFQRSPAWIKERPDRPYGSVEKKVFGRVPLAMRFHRLGIYLKYESQAIAFTRFRSLMKIAVGLPFRRLLNKQVADPTLREKLTPDYPIGCKRVLLSSNYLASLARANVELVTEGIRRVLPTGIETVDGKTHEVDAIIYGTGFAATEFLAPMSIVGRDGVDLNQAWKNGAMAYLGMTVPSFPNFFMLYGPNTNLGHNSIVFMLESQIGHVMRCLRALRNSKAKSIEVKPDRFNAFNVHVQSRLGATVWNGCKSWYVDANGHNSTNWPGFTLSYRLATKFGSLDAYRFNVDESRLSPTGTIVQLAEPDGGFERSNAVLMRGILRTIFKPLIGSPFPPLFQRSVVSVLSALMPGRVGARKEKLTIAGRSVEVLSAHNKTSPAAAILYLHGGAFCLGSASTHRSITSHLAVYSGMTVWVPNYRLAPEHPHPAAVEDALACYREIRARGFNHDQIFVAGDSAGGALALELTLRLRKQGDVPAGLTLISPVTDPNLTGETLSSRRGRDPMIRRGWLKQGLQWYAAPNSPGHQVLKQDLNGLPPMLIQVGDQEILLSDSLRLAQRASESNVNCRLEIHLGRWHVFHLQSFYLRSAVEAIKTMAKFCNDHLPASARPSAATVRSELTPVQLPG